MQISLSLRAVYGENAWSCHLGGRAIEKPSPACHGRKFECGADSLPYVTVLAVNQQNEGGFSFPSPGVTVIHCQFIVMQE